MCVCVYVPGHTHLCAGVHACVHTWGQERLVEGAPPLQAAQMMEPPALDAEQASELTLGSQLWPCSLST